MGHFRILSGTEVGQNCALLTHSQKVPCGADAATPGTTLWEPLETSIADFLDHIVKNFSKVE